jgi:hypothetical protein
MTSVSPQHPAVVLRSSYQLVQRLLAIATIAIVGLTIAVAALAINNHNTTPTSPTARANQHAISANPAVLRFLNPQH